MKIAIIEDEELHADLLEQYLLKWGSNKQVPLEIKRYQDAEAFLFEWEPGLGFDVLFIDIKMQEMNGIDMAKHVRKKDSGINIIFTTGITGYMAEGYEVEAMHYLVKPINENKIYSCMDKVLDRKEDEAYIIVHAKDEIRKIAIKHISYIEAIGHKSIIETYVKNGDKEKIGFVVASESISELEAVVTKYGMIRCHRSYLCSIPNIDHIEKTEIVFDTGSCIPVSRRRHKDVHQAFVQYFARLLRNRNRNLNGE